MPAGQKLGLGTVQFGTDYGVTNRNGRVRARQLEDIMTLARRHGISIFDTAPAYGKSEAALGRYLNDYEGARIITKTPQQMSGGTGAANASFLHNTFEQSLVKLRVDSVYGLLVHHGADLMGPNSGRLWAELESLKARHKVRRIGVSVYAPDELNRILERFPVEIVQLPINLLDQRFQRCGLLEQLGKAGIEVHARSVFLQGVLLAQPPQLPDYFRPLRSHLTALHREADKSGCSMLTIALGHTLRLNDVGTVLVGIDNASQLEQIVKAAHPPMPTDLDWDDWAVNQECWVNPSRWVLT